MNQLLSQIYKEANERKSQFTLSFASAFILLHWRLILPSLEWSLSMKERIVALEHIAALYGTGKLFWLPLAVGLGLLILFLFFSTVFRFLVYLFNDFIWPRLQQMLNKHDTVPKTQYNELSIQFADLQDKWATLNAQVNGLKNEKETAVLERASAKLHDDEITKLYDTTKKELDKAVDDFNTLQKDYNLLSSSLEQIARMIAHHVTDMAIRHKLAQNDRMQLKTEMSKINSLDIFKTEASKHLVNTIVNL